MTKLNLTLGREQVDKNVVDATAAEKAMGDFLTALGIAWQDDVNMRNTPKRVTRMFTDELYKGRTEECPNITNFDDKDNRVYNSLLTSGPWPVYSSCSHHMLPVYGSCIIGVLPVNGSPIPGLSKYGRLVEWYARRPQLQEDLVEAIANHVQQATKAKAVGVYICATHMCCTHQVGS